MITVSLEMARKLEKAGWEQKTFHKAAVAQDNSVRYGYGKIPEEDPYGNWIMLPTAEEILRELPIIIEQKIQDGTNSLAIDWLRICKCEEGFHVYYKNSKRNISKNRTRYTFKADTLANAASMMWIFLAENNLLSNE